MSASNGSEAANINSLSGMNAPDEIFTLRRVLKNAFRQTPLPKAAIVRMEVSSQVNFIGITPAVTALRKPIDITRATGMPSHPRMRRAPTLMKPLLF